MEGGQGSARISGHAHVLTQRKAWGKGDEHKAMQEWWGEERGGGGILHSDVLGNTMS